MRAARSLIAPLLVAASLAAAGCSSGGGSAADAGPAADARPDGSAADGAAADAGPPPAGNPLVPEVLAYPFPSDFYLVRDPKTATGRRVAIPQAALPKRVPASLANEADGFSRMPVIVTYLPGSVDPKTLPSPDDPAASIASASNVWLVEEGTFARVPVLAEPDLTERVDPKKRALIIRPLRALRWNTGYVVILKDGLRDLAGKPHAPSKAYLALRDGTPSGDPAVERQRRDFALVKTAFARTKLDPKRTVLAWSFHTRSAQQVTGPLLAMQQAMNRAPLSAFTIDADKVEKSGSRTNRQIRGSFQAPNFLRSDGRLNLDAAGKPVASGTRKVTFGMTIPSTVTSTRPLVIYGHGFFGSWRQATRGYFNELCTQYRYSTAATNIGFTEDNEPRTLKALATDLGDLRAVIADVLQNLANHTMLARLVRERFASRFKAPDDGTLIDRSKVHYMGVSNGSTFGAVVAATSPQFERAVLVVGAGGLIHFLERAVQWTQYGPLVNAIFPDARVRQVVFSVLQMVLDPIDAMSYVDRLVTNRFPGLKPLKAQLHMAVNDSQVRNLLTEWVARTVGAALIVPSPKVVWGLTQVRAPPPGGAPASVGAALYVYDEHVPAPPRGNIPPAKDNKTHGTVRGHTPYRKHISTFLDTGKFVHYCSGPCDPE